MQKPPFLESEKRIYLANHSPIDFYFRQSPRDFVVDEIPLYEWSGKGEHLVLKVRKKGMSTHELINHISATLGIKSGEIGYAGLKDKNALTTQYLTINKKLAGEIKRIENENIKILEENYHDNKLKIGHLKGNSFFIRLKKVDKINANKIEGAIKHVESFGMPNYFGFQRFGKDGMNHILGKSLSKSDKKGKPKRMDKFFINAYQSEIFNRWLASRVALSKMIEGFSAEEISGVLQIDKAKSKHLKDQPFPFKILEGDVMMHYPYGKLFLCEDTDGESERFAQKSISPTGLLVGSKNTNPIGDALVFEEPFFDKEIKVDGGRRYGVVFCDSIESRYIEESAHLEMKFSLQKGCYATTLLEAVKNGELERINED